MNHSLPWTGELPRHWKVLRGDRLAGRMRRSPRDEDGIVTAFRDGQVTLRTNRRTGGFTEALQEIGYQGIRRDDLVIHGMDAFAGAIGVSDSDGKASPVVHTYVGSRGEPRYLAYALRTAARMGYIRSLARGIRERSTAFDSVTFKYMDLPVPPMEEQRRIADFLDRETAQIDDLIAKQEGLVSLLRERRRAALWQRVLQQASLDRGEAWFGQPPPSWVVDKLGRRTRIVNGSTPSRSNMDYWTDGIHPWLNSSFANEDVIREADQFVTDMALAECHLPVLEPGTVVVGITGQGKTRGTVAQLEMRATINQHLAAVVPDTRYWDSRYLTLLLRSAYDELRFISDESGSTKGALTCADLHAFTVPRPPLHEQVEIATRADREIRSTDQLISHAERFIILSRERRAALISAAVIGQMDVNRKEAA